MSDKVDQTMKNAGKAYDDARVHAAGKVDETMKSAGRMYDDAGEQVRKQIEELSKIVVVQQKIVDDFVHKEPYVTMGIGVLAGLGLGLILFGLAKHRD